jgi:hypothetical protein
MLEAPGHLAVAQLMQEMGPAFSAAMFRVTGVSHRPGHNPMHCATSCKPKHPAVLCVRAGHLQLLATAFC